MKFHAFEKDHGETKVYAFEVTKNEILGCKWTDVDQKFFQNCAKGPVSRQILGISILAKRIEEESAQYKLEIRKPRKITLSEDQDELELK